ncbi:MAG TPA: NAD(P)/FAD-dependent oxidoreductase [Phycisphaerae bacterium]|nr:NAD(P)/FAD-dependent oxidoreductase [Phycisphaerae bacterium]HNU45977.1 NAD(P)/FAD-dependent oxidoreductase [Phycisphaerae bacterium]
MSSSPAELAGHYDVIVIGAGLAGLTAANQLARTGRRVLVLEQHSKCGGLATWFRRRGDHIFDVSLHGFPAGMIKSCRKYWTREIADSIIQLKRIRFDNPQFQLETTFDRLDFTRLLTQRFGIAPDVVQRFFDAARGMNFYDDQTLSTRALFARYFPGRSDVVRLLMEPITYANGSDLEDPALTYGIVFSNFMDKGVYIFQGGTDKLVRLMRAELERRGVDVRTGMAAERILIEGGRGAGVVVRGRRIESNAVLSNANLKATILTLIGREHLRPEFAEAVETVRLNNSSCQVYFGLRPGVTIEPIGDLIFSSEAPTFDADALCSRQVTSRTFSVYPPELRPGSNRFVVVASMNARYEDWRHLDDGQYEAAKQALIADSTRALEKYVPDVRARIEHAEAATPLTFEHYTRHLAGATFGTKFEGLQVSTDLPREVPGVFHTGSVGIIMSGWLGAINYGVIVANEVESYLHAHVSARVT